MAVYIKDLQPILRCKHCNKHPIFNKVATIHNWVDWSGNTRSDPIYLSSLTCPTDSSLKAESSSHHPDDKYAEHMVFMLWNHNHGEST